MHVVGGLTVLHSDVYHTGISTWCRDSGATMLPMHSHPKRLGVVLHSFARASRWLIRRLEVLCMSRGLALTNRVGCLSRALRRD